VTWNPRRKGWMGQLPREAAPVPVKVETVPTASESVVVIIPAFPMFSPAAAAELIGVHRGTVYNWLERGKLEFFRDNIGERYVLREELIRFIRDYLQRPVQV